MIERHSNWLKRAANHGDTIGKAWYGSTGA